MWIVKKALLKDLLDGNATIGPDGGIWYPSGPSDIVFESILADLVAPRQVLNKKALLALVEAANINLEE